MIVYSLEPTLISTASPHKAAKDFSRRILLVPLREIPKGPADEIDIIFQVAWRRKINFFDEDSAGHTILYVCFNINTFLNFN